MLFSYDFTTILFCIVHFSSRNKKLRRRPLYWYCSSLSSSSLINNLFIFAFYPILLFSLILYSPSDSLPFSFVAHYLMFLRHQCLSFSLKLLSSFTFSYLWGLGLKLIIYHFTLFHFCSFILLKNIFDTSKNNGTEIMSHKFMKFIIVKMVFML